ncbi:MAG: Si-specific NAD(P)(+) transhydrogenase, partial [Lentisphaeria bacterium]|nr:Si-specific NAD(P)(+) transhydrogenase [Lentisphaeria bacterium]
MTDYDVIIIGSGPGGQNAAIEAVKTGARVVVIERGREIGGSCVHHGTIPSKTLRESAVNVQKCMQSKAVLELKFKDNIQVEGLMLHKENVLDSLVDYLSDQLDKSSVELIRGRAKFTDPKTIEVTSIKGSKKSYTADTIVIAVGSSPRDPEHIPIDHENILDSDSILSMIYLPESLTVIGAGVIACEYASIFSNLGVKVTMIDKYDRPLGFLDADLTDKFITSFEKFGGTYMGQQEIADIHFDGSQVITKLESGIEVKSDKMLVAQGRVANIGRLGLDETGIELTDRGNIKVNDGYETNVPGIYAVGDVIGFPALASCSMEQGRLAICDALKLDPGSTMDLTPIGIYTIPEISTVGLSVDEAKNKYEHVYVGKADFSEMARGQISGIQDGLLKMVIDHKGQLLGVQIVG